jgi:hypothetical protein
MLAALRRVLWQHRISPKSMFSARVQEILDTVAYALFQAAFLQKHLHRYFFHNGSWVSPCFGSLQKRRGVVQDGVRT